MFYYMNKTFVEILLLCPHETFCFLFMCFQKILFLCWPWDLQYTCTHWKVHHNSFVEQVQGISAIALPEFQILDCGSTLRSTGKSIVQILLIQCIMYLPRNSLNPIYFWIYCFLGLFRLPPPSPINPLQWPGFLKDPHASLEAYCKKNLGKLHFKLYTLVMV